ncbi:MAG TPA: hypothetical protein VFB38_18995 [Chthonomonadaceae bacterium]|nr:hypothetical protein [Chthonomonadaceae bacterium]
MDQQNADPFPLYLRRTMDRVPKLLLYLLPAALLALLLQAALTPAPVSAAPDTQDGHVSAIPATGSEPYVFVVRGGRLYAYYLKLQGPPSKLILIDSTEIGDKY